MINQIPYHKSLFCFQGCAHPSVAFYRYLFLFLSFLWFGKATNIGLIISFLPFLFSHNRLLYHKSFICLNFSYIMYTFPFISYIFLTLNLYLHSTERLRVFNTNFVKCCLIKLFSNLCSHLRNNFQYYSKLHILYYPYLQQDFDLTVRKDSG